MFKRQLFFIGFAFNEIVFFITIDLAFHLERNQNASYVRHRIEYQIVNSTLFQIRLYR